MFTLTRRFHLGPLLALCLALLLAVLVFLLLAQPVYATPYTAPQGPAHADPFWRAAYWNNTDLSGAPTLTREETALDHDWGNGSPDSRIAADHFSAAWTRYLDLPSGAYRFTTSSDDGIRVWVDDRLIIDHWTIHSLSSDTADVHLDGGHHLVRVEYFEDTGAAVAKLTWTPLDTPAQGEWRGEYFPNRDLSGPPAFVHGDDDIAFDWEDGSPAPGLVGRDDFSARWTRTVHFDAGRVRFTVTADDGVRLWVNQHLLIDAWRDQAATTYRGDIYLPAGNVPIRLEYYEHTGDASVRLDWARRDQPAEDTWRGEYFDNRYLSGSPEFERRDTEIDFDWEDDSPAPGRLDNDNFSVRWSATWQFRGGRYRFTTETDDGARLYIDGRLVIDEWHDMPLTRFTHTRRLDAGTHTLRMEYYEHHGSASAKLSWKRVEGEDEDEEEPPRVGNIITCLPPLPQTCAWIKIYRMDPSGTWIDLSPRGYSTCVASGFLKIDGLPVDPVYGDAGQPYWVEQWVDNVLVHSTGNIQRGETEFRVRPWADNYTPWACGP